MEEYYINTQKAPTTFKPTGEKRGKVGKGGRGSRGG